MVVERAERIRRRARMEQLAATQAGVLTRAQVGMHGVTRSQVRAEVDAGRWRVAGRECLAIAPAPADAQLGWWLAVLEASPRIDIRAPRAALGGLTALHAAGLQGIEGDGLVHVCAPKSSRPLSPAPGVRVHETRRWNDDDVIVAGIPRIRPEVATVQAALWARTDREAALLLVAPVQQRLTTVDLLGSALDRVLRDRRRRLLRSVFTDIVGGVRSLNELDFAAMCRRRGLPEPDRQVVVSSAVGRSYLDVRWTRWRVVVEIDGLGHLQPDRWIEDSLRHNEIALSGDVVLRIPSLGFRLDPDRHLDAVERALRRAGWRG
jgi:very-short-patch-repair endonuclease